MLKLYLFLKGYRKIPFTYIERHNSIHYPFRYSVTVFESDRELDYAFEDNEDTPLMLSKISKEENVKAICVHDHKNKYHYYKELKRWR